MQVFTHSCSQDLGEPDSFKRETATKGLGTLDVPPSPPSQGSFLIFIIIIEDDS